MTEYAALIERAEDLFRATASAPFDMTAIGTTESEALARLDADILQRLRRGAKVVTRPLEAEMQHPLSEFAGDLQAEPLAADWQTAMKAYRQAVEEDPNYL